MKDHFESSNSVPTGRGLRHPLLGLLLILVPHSVLLLLAWWDYSLISPLLQESAQTAWCFYYGWLGFQAVLLSFPAALYSWIKRPLPVVPYALLILLAAVVWTRAYVGDLDTLIHTRDDAILPQWMYDPMHLIFYPATFIAPSVVYALLLLVERATPDETGPFGLVVNLAITVLFPIALYLFGLAAPSGLFGSSVWDLIGPLLFMALSLAFGFLLVRSLWLILCTSLVRGFVSGPWRYPVYGLLTVVLPLAGLALNSHGEWIDLGELTHFFGNYSHPVWYALAIAAGVLVLLPQPRQDRLAVALWFSRWLVAPFSLFFVLVFLPYLPFALLLILLVGLGFLMLSPFVLGLLHVFALRESRERIRSVLSPLKAWGLAGIAALILPAMLTAHYLKERTTLRAALDAIYEPDFSRAESGVDAQALAETLFRLRLFKAGAETPYLDSWYRWIVLDQLTLPDAKIEVLERVFLGQTQEQPAGNSSNFFGFFGRRSNFEPRTVDRSRTGSLQSISVRPIARPGEAFYETEVELTVVNAGGAFQGEYRTEFELPDDAIVSDHYLYIDGRREPGILAEKRAALWVYTQIVSVRADPGLLRYLIPGRLELRVFPVMPDSPRRTGFRILHARPLQLNIDGRRVILPAPAGDSVAAAFPTETQLGDLGLRMLAPRPEQHGYPVLVFDCSRDMDRHRSEELFRRLLSALELSGTPVRLYCSNQDLAFEQFTGGGDSTEVAGTMGRIMKHGGTGGFFLERAMQYELYRNSTDSTGGHPVFIVVAPAIDRAIFTGQLPAWNWMLPERDIFHYDGQSLHALSVFGVSSPDAGDWREASFEQARAALRAPGNPDLLPRIASEAATRLRPEGLAALSDYQRGVVLRLLERQSTLRPADSALHHALLQESFRYRLLVQETAFLALENEAQKEALRRKQAETLHAHSAFESLERSPEEVQRLDEPPLWFLIAGMLAILLFRVVWRRRLSGSAGQAL